MTEAASKANVKDGTDQIAICQPITWSESAEAALVTNLSQMKTSTAIVQTHQKDLKCVREQRKAKASRTSLPVHVQKAVRDVKTEEDVQPIAESKPKQKMKISKKRFQKAFSSFQSDSKSSYDAIKISVVEEQTNLHILVTIYLCTKMMQNLSEYRSHQSPVDRSRMDLYKSMCRAASFSLQMQKRTALTLRVE